MNTDEGGRQLSKKKIALTTTSLAAGTTIGVVAGSLLRNHLKLTLVLSAFSMILLFKGFYNYFQIAKKLKNQSTTRT